MILIYIPIIGIAVAIFSLITILLTFFSVSEKFHNDTPITESNKVSIVSAFRQITVPINDKKFRKFLSVRFFNSISGKILGILIIPFLAFVLKFRESEFFIYIIVSILTKFSWYLIWRKILTHRSLISKFSVLLLFSTLASLFDLIFLFQNLSFTFKIILFIATIGTVLGSMYAFPLFSIPLGAKLVHDAACSIEEESPTISISKLSGAYYGSLTFMASIGQALASLMLGIILSGSNESNPIIITLSLSSMGIFYLMSLIFIKRIRLN